MNDAKYIGYVESDEVVPGLVDRSGSRRSTL